jgi:hypothetical protein
VKVNVRNAKYGSPVSSWMAFLIVFSTLFVRGESFFQTAETMWFHPNDPSKVKVATEFQGLSALEAAKAVAKTLGGNVSVVEVLDQGPAQRISGAGTPVFKEQKNLEYHISGGKLGEIVIKPRVRDNGSRDGVELVASHVGIEDASRLQKALDSLKTSGARGANPESNLSMKIEAALPFEKMERGVFLTNLARNFTNPNHVEQMKESGLISKFAPQFSGEMQKRLMDSHYQPSLEELYQDAVVRQTAELLGLKDAFRLPLGEVKKKMFSHAVSEIDAALKKNPATQILGGLATEFPQEPLSALMKRQNGGASGAVITFNNDWNLDSHLRQTLGVMGVTHEHGGIDHDRYVAAQSGIVENTLAQLRRDQKKASETGRPLLFRYFLADPRKPLPRDGATDFHSALPLYQPVTLGVIPSESNGKQPVVLSGGDSVIFHNRTYQGSNIQGTYNPGILNGDIAQLLTDNKYAEARFFEKYQPGSIPETHLLSRMGIEDINVDSVVNSLNQKYPKGWVIKAVKEQNTGRFLVHNGRDLKKLYEDYKKSDFDTYKAKVDQEMVGRDLDEIFAEYQKHPAFLGWKIANYLKNPELAIVQKKVDIDKEFRVEAIGGKILSDGSTIDRHFYADLDPDEPFKYPKQNKEIIDKVEAFAQSILDSLPEKLRGTPFAFDIAYLKDGSCMIIESNAGPESGFLTEWPPSIKALHRFMADYPKAVKEGRVSHEGMTAKEQLEYMKGRMKEWNMDPMVQFPDYHFGEEKIERDWAKPKEGAEHYTIGKPFGHSCPQAFQKLSLDQ